MSFCNSPSQPANSLRIGGVSTYVAPGTQRIVKRILPIDERIDGEGFGEGYQIRSRLVRGQFSHMEAQQDNDTLQLNPTAKVIFSVAGVTFEVRAHYCVSEAEATRDRLALEGTKQIRPGAVRPFRTLAAHFASGGQGRRRNPVRRDGNLGEDHPANVRSDAYDFENFVRLCQTWAFR